MDDFDGKDPIITHHDDDDDYRGFRNPFQTPSGAFPHDDSEKIEMSSTSHTRGDTSGTAETSFIDNILLISREWQKSAWKYLTAKFSEASAIDLTADYSKTSRLEVSKGAFKRKYFLFTTNKNTGEEQLKPQPPKEKRLGPTSELIQYENEKEITRRKKKLEKLKNLQDSVAENQRDNIDHDIEEEEEQITNLENENEQLGERLPLRERIKNIFKKYDLPLLQYYQL